MIIYILMLVLGIVIGTAVTIICNIVNKKSDERQFLDDYKKIIRECLNYQESENDSKKNEELK